MQSVSVRARAARKNAENVERKDPTPETNPTYTAPDKSTESIYIQDDLAPKRENRKKSAERAENKIRRTARLSSCPKIPWTEKKNGLVSTSLSPIDSISQREKNTKKKLCPSATTDLNSVCSTNLSPLESLGNWSVAVAVVAVAVVAASAAVASGNGGGGGASLPTLRLDASDND